MHQDHLQNSVTNPPERAREKIERWIERRINQRQLQNIEAEHAKAVQRKLDAKVKAATEYKWP